MQPDRNTPRRWTSAIARGAAVVAVLGLVQPMTISAQDPAPSPELVARLKGGWQLNREKSQIPPPPVGLMPTPPGRGQEKKGGLTGGVGGGGGNQEPARETDTQIQAKAALREVQPPPPVLYINVSPTEVVLTTDTGTIRRFSTDGKSQTLQLGEARTSTKTSWLSNGSLTQEFSAGPLKLFRKWAVSDDGSQLIVTVRAEGGIDRAPPPPMMMVYDRK